MRLPFRPPGSWTFGASFDAVLNPPTVPISRPSQATLCRFDGVSIEIDVAMFA